LCVEYRFLPLMRAVGGRAGGFGKRSGGEFSVESVSPGIDIAAPIGEVIKAAGKGRVVFGDRLVGAAREC
jgi:murein DD-endopeptidase MepM/ murein hydrolase activator NlpD